MAEFVRGYIVVDVGTIHEKFKRLQIETERLTILERAARVDWGGRSMLADINLAYRQFNDGLREAAVKGAAAATKDMKQHLKDSLKRPESGSSPSLMSLLGAVPLAIAGYETGAVGVADVAQLNRAINPLTGHISTYWRALEYGTGQNGVPSQVGRVLLGTFADAGGGNVAPPLAQFAGGGGPHSIFLPKRSGAFPPGAAAGFGTISHEIQAKHFIKHGADEAGILWRRNISDVEQRAIKSLSGIKLARP